jgi:hypothetical protein
MRLRSVFSTQQLPAPVKEPSQKLPSPVKQAKQVVIGIIVRIAFLYPQLACCFAPPVVAPL